MSMTCHVNPHLHIEVLSRGLPVTCIHPGLSGALEGVSGSTHYEGEIIASPSLSTVGRETCRAWIIKHDKPCDDLLMPQKLIWEINRTGYSLDGILSGPCDTTTGVRK